MLREATQDLSWLWTRGYADDSSIKLVGDRYGLTKRQRTAVARCACSDRQLLYRRNHQVDISELACSELWIDGYNVITSIEAALANGVILHARDGCYRDMASMHGSYRKVEETIPAIELLGRTMEGWNLTCCRWFLDRPVSNSGMLKQLLLGLADDNGWSWQVELTGDPDPILKDADHIVASADSQVLDCVASWFNLARAVIALEVQRAWLVDLGGQATD